MDRQENQRYGRLAESCSTDNLEEAERYLAHRINEIRQAVVYGIRPTRTFEQAAVKYLNDYQHKKSLERDVYAFKRIMPHIGDLTLDRIHNDTLAQYRQARRADGVTAGTINKEGLRGLVWVNPESCSTDSNGFSTP